MLCACVDADANFWLAGCTQSPGVHHAPYQQEGAGVGTCIGDLLMDKVSLMLPSVWSIGAVCRND